MKQSGIECRERFLAAYIANGGDGPAAYEEAVGRKLNARWASRRAFALLREPSVIAAIQTALGVEARVIEELKAIGFANLADYVTWTNGEVSIKDSASLTPRQTAALVEIAQSRDGVRLKFDKLAALTLLIRHFGIGSGARPRTAIDPPDTEPQPEPLTAGERKRRIAHLLAEAASSDQIISSKPKKSIDNQV